MDEVVWTVTVIIMLLHLLSVFHCSGKVYSELFCHAFDAIRVLTIDAFLLIGALFC